MANLYLDICLSDIPCERITTAKNGKKYLKAIIRPRKETDRDGYDHYIAAFIPSAERRQGDGPAFIGRAQEKHYDDNWQQQPTRQQQSQHAPARNDGGGDPGDLPF